MYDLYYRLPLIYPTMGLFMNVHLICLYILYLHSSSSFWLHCTLSFLSPTSYNYTHYNDVQCVHVRCVVSYAHVFPCRYMYMHVYVCLYMYLYCCCPFLSYTYLPLYSLSVGGASHSFLPCPFYRKSDTDCTWALIIIVLIAMFRSVCTCTFSIQVYANDFACKPMNA